MVVNKGENIGFTLQLIKSDGTTVEEEATVTYRILDDTGIVELVSEQTATYNTTTESYVDSLVPSASWTNQEVGSFLIVWSISDTDCDFNSTYTEDLQVNIDKDKIDKILGLVHQNILIDNPVYDGFHNLISARVRIYSEAGSVGTSNNIIGTYNISAPSNKPGKFVTWSQVEA